MGIYVYCTNHRVFCKCQHPLRWKIHRFFLWKMPCLGVSETASAKMASAIDVRIDDAGSILKFRIGFSFGESSAGFCHSVWLPESILNFRIGSVSSIGGLIAAALFADTISGSANFAVFRSGSGVSDPTSAKNSDSQIQESPRQTKPKKGAKRKVHEFHPFFCEFWCFSLGKQARFTLNFLFRNAPEKSS